MSTRFPKTGKSVGARRFKGNSAPQSGEKQFLGWEPGESPAYCTAIARSFDALVCPGGASRAQPLGIHFDHGMHGAASHGRCRVSRAGDMF